MTTRTRLVAVLLALLLPAGTLAAVMSGAGSTGVAFDAESLPRRVADLHVLHDITMEPDVIAMLDPVSYAFRVYAPAQETEASSDATVGLYLAYYHGREGNGAHDPNVCYPAQGWEVVAREPTRLVLENGEVMLATRLHARKGNDEEEVLYWFQPAHRWPSGDLAEVMLRFVDSVMGRPQYGFVRLSASSAPDAAKAEDLARMAREIAPVVRAELERTR